MNFTIDEIWIEEDAGDETLSKEIIRKLPLAKTISGRKLALRKRELELETDPFLKGKRILRLMRHQGAFIKECPGTPNYVCCGLEILHIGQGCPMDCRYCALQIYFNRSVLEVFVNTRDMINALEKHLDSDGFHRICTGEFADSLALDHLTGINTALIDFFSSRKNAALEIKTKTDATNHLLDLTPRGRVTLAFSMNAQTITKTEELRSAPLDRRLTAASKAVTRGYKTAFHFDPIIPHKGWEKGYIDTIDEIFRNVPAESISWISLGVLRFTPELKTVSGRRFGAIPYFHDGFIRGADGKSRFFSKQRIRIYRRLADRIREHASDATVYLCMESPHVWQEALGLPMKTDQELAMYLDNSLTFRATEGKSISK